MADIPCIGMKPILIIDGAYTQLIFQNADDSDEYICIAKPGTASSATGWQIRKITYSATGKIATVKWAGGTDRFVNIADNRASLSYS